MESPVQVNKRKSPLRLAPDKSLIMPISGEPSHPPTNYCETLMHLLKGNIGPGLYAMGDAFMNGGLLVSTVLTVFIALVCLNCQHVLVNCAKRIRELTNEPNCPDYADTVEQVFYYGPKRTRSWSKAMRISVNVFICVTQLGFCCIYFVFISTNVDQILQLYDIHCGKALIMLYAFVPILLTSLITNLKLLTPVSSVANVCMISGLAITFYFALRDGLPPVSERELYREPWRLALFFGTTIFAFEGIALVLPLKNAMGNPDKFERPLGVLNVGMFFITLMFASAGFLGYYKWGDKVRGSLTLNLGESVLANCVKLMVSCGVLLGYPLQFFIAIQIMWPNIKSAAGCTERHLAGELVFRTVMVMVTLAIAELVPALGLFISLIGAFCSSALALVFPPIIELLMTDNNGKGPGVFLWMKNIFMLILALLGFVMGTYEALKGIIDRFSDLHKGSS